VAAWTEALGHRCIDQRLRINLEIDAELRHEGAFLLGADVGHRGPTAGPCANELIANFGLAIAQAEREVRRSTGFQLAWPKAACCVSFDDVA